MRHTHVPDTSLTSAQHEFRDAIRAFLRSPRVTESIRSLRKAPPGHEAGLLDVYRWLGERGWLAPSWPVKYGGLGRGLVESAIVTEELCLAGIPDDAHVLGIDIVGMFLLGVGTEAQRDQWLPSLARGERLAAVLLTEPDCGSDLSRLTTRAEPDGDGWRVYGTKVFNQKTQFADVALCAARTSQGPVPFDGITLFLLPLRSPGVLISPVTNLTNDRFNEVVIDGVRLTEADVIGEVGAGWQLLNDMLVFERTGIDFHAKIRRWLDGVAPDVFGARPVDPELATRYAELDAALCAGRALAWRVITELDRGVPDPVTASMAKWYITEHARDVVRFCVDVRGLTGALSAWDHETLDHGLVETACRYAPTLRLGSGTSEIMLYIIASSALELL